jgi:predicted nuclease of predicted toxin-antitoxin system
VNFLLDQDVPERVAQVLLREGHAVTTLRQVMSAGASDASVWRYAQEQGIVLVTCNRQDFLNLASTQAHAGLIILIRRRTRIAECAAILRLVRKAGSSGIGGNINFA